MERRSISQSWLRFILTLCNAYAHLCPAPQEARSENPLPACSAPVQQSSAPAQQALDPLGLHASVEDGRQFAKTFSMVTPSADRKRVLGAPCRFKEHKQGRSGRRAVQSGYQMKRGLVPPLFSHEVWRQRLILCTRSQRISSSMACSTETWRRSAISHRL